MIAINRDSGEIVWDKQIAKPNEFGIKERFNSAPVTAEEKSWSRTAPATAAPAAGSRRWTRAPATTVALVCRPKPGDPGSETWKERTTPGRPAAAGMWQTGSYDPVNKLTIWGPEILFRK